jgi:hypothetical protein
VAGGGQAVAQTGWELGDHGADVGVGTDEAAGARPRTSRSTHARPIPLEAPVTTYAMTPPTSHGSCDASTGT